MFSLSSDTPVMSFDHNKLMKINYDPRLISFVKEVRELSSMGFKIAPQISRNSKLAEDFMQQAKDLEEVLLLLALDVEKLIGPSFITLADCHFSQQHW